MTSETYCVQMPRAPVSCRGGARSRFACPLFSSIPDPDTKTFNYRSPWDAHIDEANRGNTHDR